MTRPSPAGGGQEGLSAVDPACGGWREAPAGWVQLTGRVQLAWAPSRGFPSSPALSAAGSAQRGRTWGHSQLPPLIPGGGIPCGPGHSLSTPLPAGVCSQALAGCRLRGLEGNQGRAGGTRAPRDPSLTGRGRVAWPLPGGSSRPCQPRAEVLRPLLVLSVIGREGALPGPTGPGEGPHR